MIAAVGQAQGYCSQIIGAGLRALPTVWGLRPLRWSQFIFALAATQAQADEHIRAADNGDVACAMSSTSLTRIALVGDSFASVSKITTGSILDDFTVTNDPVRGDIYLSVAAGFVGAKVSFFATSKRGFVYKFACSPTTPDATQVFVTNPAVALEAEGDDRPHIAPRDAAVRLIQAMSRAELVDGFEISQPAGVATRLGQLSLRLIAEYRGQGLIGKVIRLDNRSTATMTLKAVDLAPVGTVAIGLQTSELKSGAASTAFIVGLAGAVE